MRVRLRAVPALMSCIAPHMHAHGAGIAEPIPGGICTDMHAIDAGVAGSRYQVASALTCMRMMQA